MGRMWGILFIVLTIWVGMEIYTVGLDDAFGGVFAGWAGPIEPNRSTAYDAGPTKTERSITQRVRAKVTSDIDSAFGRRDDAIEDND